MTVPTSAAIIAAAQDQDLKQRAIAIAARMGIVNPDYAVQQAGMRLTLADVSDQGDTVASVYEYAKTLRDDALAAVPEPVGQDLSAVTDEHLQHALQSLIDAGIIDTPAVTQ